MSALNDSAFGDSALESVGYRGSWTGIVSFDYEAGATVYITADMVSTIPDGTTAMLFMSEDGITWTQVKNGAVTYITYTSEFSGLTQLHIKIEFETHSDSVTPVVYSLALSIHQETSLYTIGTQVLADALVGRNAEWVIDTELQKYKLPYAWLETMSHREALAKIAEAGGGVAYQDRYGKVRLQAGNFIARKKGEPETDTILDNRIFSMSSPVVGVANKVEITTRPYSELTAQVVWTLSGDNHLYPGEVKTYIVSYSDFDAVVDAIASITGTGASITGSVYRFGGADITVSASSPVDITLSITGKPLKIVGSRVITESDGDSIRRYGVKTLAINENNLIQDVLVAETIAEDIVSVTKNPNRDIELEWRGDPTNELGDIVEVNGTRAVIVSQEFELATGLTCTTKLRRF